MSRFSGLEPRAVPSSGPTGQPSGEPVENPFIVNVGGEQYRVVDGDTVERLSDNQSIRISGIDTQERQKYDSDNNKFKRAEQEGEFGKLALYQAFKNGSYSDFNFEENQTEGAGADRRIIGNFTNADGTKVSDELIKAGLAESYNYGDERDKRADDLKLIGDVQRSIFGDDGYDNLRGARPTGDYYKAKTKALTNNGIGDPDYNYGVRFTQRDRDGQGNSRNVFSTAWSNGVSAARGDIGGAINALGFATQDLIGGDFSQGLKDFGAREQGKAAIVSSENPFIRNSSITNVLADSDNYWDYLKNGTEWIGVNTVQSVPYLGAIAAGTVAGVGATALSGGGALAVGGAVLANAPLVALHAGNVWNQVDDSFDAEGNRIDHRDSGAAGKAFTAGVAMATLDKLGLTKAIAPSSILTKQGREKVVDLLVNKSGGALTRKQATRQLNATSSRQTADLLAHMDGFVKDQDLKANAIKQIVAAAGSGSAINALKATAGAIGGPAARLGGAAAWEGFTEAAQELSAYMTAKQIKGDFELSPEEAWEFFTEKWGEEDSDLKHLILESAAAGAGVGSAFHVAAGAKARLNDARVVNDTFASFDPTTRNGYEQIYNDPALVDNNTFIDNLHTEEEFSTDANGNVSKVGAKASGLFNNLSERGNQTNFIKDKFGKDGSNLKYDPDTLQTIADETFSLDTRKLNVASALETVAHYGKKAVQAPWLAALGSDGPALLTRSKTLAGLSSLLTDTRGIAAGGRTFESEIQYKNSVLDNISNINTAKKHLGVSNFKHSHRIGQTIAVRSIGQYLSENNINSVGATTNAQLDTINKKLKVATEAEGAKFKPLTRKDLKSYDAVIQDQKAFANTVFEVELESIKRDHGKNSKRAKDFEKTYNPDFWWEHQEFDKGKIARQKKEFIQFIDRKAKDAVAKGNLTEAEKKRLKNPSFAEDTWRSIVHNNRFDTSLVSGDTYGISADKRKILDVSRDPEFRKFASNDMWKDNANLSSDVAQRSTITEYFGDGASKLDTAFSKIRKELEDSGMDPKDVDVQVKRAAATTKDIIDASTGNYRRIKNKKYEAFQATVSQWTAISGLLLAGFSSIPEFATVMFDLSGSAEAKNAFSTTMKEMMGGTKRFFNNTLYADTGSAITGITDLQKKRTESVYKKVLDRTGLTINERNLHQKLGIDESSSGGKVLSNLHSGFFTVNGLKGITEMQKMINASVAIDFIRMRAESLAMQKKNGTELTQQQGDFKAQLRGLGVNVDALVDATIAAMDKGDSKAQYNSIFELDDAAYDNVSGNLQEQLEIGIQSFVNHRIQNPGGANRPLWLQDPHWRLFTLFQGFTGTVTTTLVPRLWNDKAMAGIKQGRPWLTYDAFSIIIAMSALGFLSQLVKDEIKYDEEDKENAPWHGNPYLDTDQVIQRAFLSSGVLGQYEKVVNVIKPQYGGNSSIPARVAGEAAGVGGRYATSGAEIVNDVASGNNALAVNTFLKHVPFTSSFKWLRDDITGR